MNGKCVCGADIPDGQKLCHSCDRKTTKWVKRIGLTLLGVFVMVVTAGRIKPKL